MQQSSVPPVATRIEWRPWLAIALLSTGLAVVSLLSDLQSEALLSRSVPDQLAVARWVLSQLLNSGVLWAGAQLLAGAVMARPLRGALAAVLTGEASLVLHYALGRLLGTMPVGVWEENAHWFVIAVIAGVPLGAMGALWRRQGLSGLVARLLVPVGAIVEPFLRHWLSSRPEVVDHSTPSLVAERISGWTLLVLGAIGIIVAVASWRRRARKQLPSNA
ncbi:Uncharacterised protein [Actinomyces bovis]|uniref:Peptidase S54 rhomboid domain-containing protein n=1 Tax=Actinomyces bovis TaxID=1658 RepID=A0ABY1VPJ6_9ACTO|nr:hypothetical protein [Actinomyces bovis]SPT53367.1 Uncharacterised protein [Actinomyces bovis]VEG52750.1 Uncharacterised protein [Actinomyces israelii]